MTLKVRENVILAPLTTFRIGGPARYFVDVVNEGELREALAQAHALRVPFILLAIGSNVLMPDEGLDAFVIHTVGGRHSFDRPVLAADAGCNLLHLIKAAGEKNLGGWEKLAGIPGTVGGAVRGNAGAFGSEIKDFAVSASALNAETGELRAFSNSECDFSYRHSFFKDHPEWIITKTVVQLRPIDAKESARLAEETIAERERRHLQNVCAAGSFFMNPVAPPAIVALFEQEKKVRARENRVPAGWLIEKAGLKGARVGGAVASEQHPNYIVNTGGATAKDVLALAEKIKEEVRKQFGVELHEEAAVFHN